MAARSSGAFFLGWMREKPMAPPFSGAGRTAGLSFPTQDGFPLRSGRNPLSCGGGWKQSGMCFLSPEQISRVCLQALDMPGPRTWEKTG